MKRIIHYSIIGLLLFIQLLFLLAIVRENAKGYLVPIGIISIVIVLLYVYLRIHFRYAQNEFESLRIAAWVPIGAWVCYYFNHGLNFGPVLGAALVGTLASFLPNINKSSTYLAAIPAAIYCGAFVGMSRIAFLNGPLFVTVASFFTALLLLISKNILHGIGGKLGTLAFSGVVITYIIFIYLAN